MRLFLSLLHMAEQENITAMDETHNPEPSNLNDEDKGMKSDPTKLVQAIVADRDFISSIPAAIMTTITPQLKHMVEHTNNEYVGFSAQTTAINLVVSVDQTGTAHHSKPGVSDDQTGDINLTNPVVSDDQTGNKRSAEQVIDIEAYTPTTKQTRRNTLNENTINDVNIDSDTAEGDILSPNSCWEASEELAAFLETATCKPLSKFERRNLVKASPRPNVNAVYTPSMDEYLKPFVQGITLPDKPLKEMQDHVLDVFGPLSTIYENLLVMLESCNSDGAVELDKDSVLNFLTCLKHAMLLAGDASARLSVSRRELVLKKINPLMVSLAQEHFPDTERHLFGPNFERRLKTRSETAETIGKASRLGKPFFRGGASRGFQRPRGGRQWNQYRQVRPFQPIMALRGSTTGVEDNPPDSRAHGPTAHGSSNPISEKPTSNQFAQRYVFRNFTIQFNTEGASNWASKSLHPTMDDAHTGPVGFANHSGSSHRIYESSCSAFLARNAQSTPSTGEGARSGNERTISQQSHSSSPNPHPIKQGIHKFYIHSPQKRWGEPPSYKFKTTKPVLNLRTFQNGGNPYVERPSKTKRLSCKDRPQGRLPNCADLERSSEIPSISVEGNTARICLPPLWVSHSPQGVPKVDETGSSGFKTTGYSSNNLPRRHTNYARIGSLSITPCSFNSEPPGGSGIYSQLQQVPVNPLPEYRVFGFSDQFNQSHPPVARGETQENPKDLPRYSRKDRNFGSRVIKIPGPPNLFHPGHFPRPPPLPTSSKAEEYYNDLRAIVRGHINTRFSSPRGSSVVARPPSRVEWQSAIPTPNRPYNRDRCLSKGLGGILRRGQHWRPMVFRGEKTTHQLARATRRVVCNQNIHKDHSMCTCETIDGQCSSSCIYKQNGGGGVLIHMF